MGHAVSPLVAGVDLGGTNIRGRVLDPADATRMVVTARVDTPRGGDAIVKAVGDVIEQLDAAVADEGIGPLASVGVGAAGLVDLTGVLRFAPNLPTVVELDLAAELQARAGVPVAVDNDANCALLAEHRVGAAMGARNAVLVALGTGIGAGVLVDGIVQRGSAGFAGEPGHMVVDPTGPPCPCGRRGCWERFGSGTGLGRLARDAAEAGQAARVVELAGGSVEAVRGEHVTRAVLEEDPDALEIFRQFAWWVALGMANLVNILDAELVVIGGGLVEAGETLLLPLREAFRGLVLAADHRPPVRITAATLGSGAGAIGAGLLAADLLARGGDR